MKQVISFEKEIAFKTMIGEISSISLEHTLHFSSDSTVEGDLIISGTYKMTEASTLEENFQYALPIDIMLTNELEEDARKLSIDNFTYDIVNEEILHIYVDILIQGREKLEISDVIVEEEQEEVPVLEEVREVKEEVLEVVEEEQEVIAEDDSEEIVELEQEVLEDTEEEESSSTFKQEEEKEQPPLLHEEVPMEKENTHDTREEVTLEGEKDFLKQQNLLESLTKEKTQENAVLEEEEPVQKESTNGAVMNSIFSAFANTDETYSTYSIYILRENDNVDEILNKYNVTREELSLYNNLDDLKVGCKLIIPTMQKDGI